MGTGNGLEDYFVIRNQKKMRFGYTTGSCAAAACKGAARMLLGGERLEQVELMTPKGILLKLKLEEIVIEDRAVSCAVRKDGGDDPDTTHGALIHARVELLDPPGEENAPEKENALGKENAPGKENALGRNNAPEGKTALEGENAREGIPLRDEERFLLDGGEGVGRVTKPGLSQAIGEAAINPVPKSMILREAKEAADCFGYTGRLKILIFVPGGEEIARKTFNPRLGILGGISILGTSGIVEPMSEKALIESIRVEMGQRVACGEEYLLMTPGNYGADYLREHMSLPFEKNIKCSNYVGETIDMAAELGVKGILFVSHIGKFVKVAAGIMNTHSHCADGRMEILCANAIRAGGDLDCAREILQCGTTDEALELLARRELLEGTMREITERIQFYLDHRSYRQMLLGAVIFSNTQGYLGQTKDAEELIRRLS